MASYPSHLKKVVYENYACFLPSSHVDFEASSSGVHPISMIMVLTLEACYCGVIKKILKVDFRIFQKYIFDVKWFEGIAKRHGSGIYVIDHTKIWKGKKDTYVLIEHCEQVCFSNHL